jgi:hypothetical protein
MNSKNRRALSDIECDPFGERSSIVPHKTMQLMGGRFQFESTSSQLMRLVDQAYLGLPRHRFSSNPPSFRVRLMLTPRSPRPPQHKSATRRRSEPSPISMLHGPDVLGAATESSTFVLLSPKHRTALLSISPAMLAFPYHVRYELLEFAVFTLASRAQRLVPLHAACVGLDGRGILLMGSSGAGKTTVALQCLLEGFDFLSEDSVFVAPKSMRATGTANFLHVRTDSLRWLGRSRARSIIGRSPVIQRRSGIEKFEVDLRQGIFRLAKAPLKIIGVAFLSSRSAGKGPLLRPLSQSDTLARLKREQAYGAGLPQWGGFSRNLLRLGGFEILRGAHPATSVEVLRSLLQQAITKFRRSPA